MSAIPLGPSLEYNNNQPTSTQIPHQEEERKVVFADEIIIEDQMILTISAEKMFEEAPKRKRKSRWGEKPERKTAKPESQHLHFNPLEAMMNRKAILPMNTLSLQMNPMMQLGLRHAPQPPMPPAHPRWGPSYEKTFQPPSLNAIPPNLTIDDLEYIIRLYCLDDVYQKLQNPIDPKYDDKDLRSPSPEPIYDANGKRVNTRDNRRRENLLKTKCNLIEECQKMRKSFVPPTDFKPLKKSQKVYLTDTAYTPETNYIGIIIGPKGTTQKMLEAKTGCKISIRGKGASKTKKVELDSDDKLHVLIQSDTDEALQKGVDAIEKLLRGEEEDDAKKNQRLQLQVISGVLRDDFCELCHEKGHRSWACPSRLAWTRADVKCEICGERSHPTHDCPRKNDTANKSAYIQSEYNKFEKEIGRPQQQPQATAGSFQERVSFITETQFTGFQHNKQLVDDPETMKRLEEDEKKRKDELKNQMNALNQYTKNNPQFTVQEFAQQQMQQEYQKQNQMLSQMPPAFMGGGGFGGGYNYFGQFPMGYDPYMMNPMMYYGYSQQQVYGQYPSVYGMNPQQQPQPPQTLQQQNPYLPQPPPPPK